MSSNVEAASLTDGLLEPRFVSEITGEFFVPAYQRGYRWGAPEVERLLDDLRESNGQTYYLQPLVVKSRGEDSWELVDGQQRLTTLYLIVQYMLKEGLQNVGPSYRIMYETREGSSDFLEQLAEADSLANIDYAHIFGAYRTIADWFERDANSRQYIANKIYGYLFESVKVIWYEAPESMDSTELFTRLNVGRIPLTDAELVKALLLTKLGDDGNGADRAHEVAAQWDAFERDLRPPELWAFITGSADGEATHISLLLDTLAGGPRGRERPPFHTFESLRARIDTDPLGFWNDVTDLHSLVVGWYEDRDLFHRIGYLAALGESFAELVRLSEGETRSEFEAALVERIKNRINLTDEKLVDLDYESDGDKCAQVLLLMNVETVRRTNERSARFSFEAHAAGDWSLEHVHAQNAQALKTVEQWSAWLSLQKEAIESMRDVGAEHDELLSQIDSELPGITRQSFEVLERRVRSVLSPESEVPEGLHLLPNLALLSATDNSALSNSLFLTKRKRIIEMDRDGCYIPVCTRNVFLKYYSDHEDQQPYFWAREDRDAYFAAMREQLVPYLEVDDA